MIVYIFAISRIIANSTLNIFQKKLTIKNADPFFIVLITYLFLSVLFIPALFFLKLSNLSFNFWINIIIASNFAAIGNILLVESLKLVDFSLFGPMNSYKSIVSMFIGYFVINEIPDFKGIIGVIIILLGSYILTYNSNNNFKNNIGLLYFISSKGFLFRFSSLFLTSIACVYLKKSIIYSSPFITFVFWLIFGLPIVLVISFIHFILNKNMTIDNVNIFKKNKMNYILVLLFISLMQILTLITFQKKLVSYSLALFQLSSVINVFLGYKLFNEKDIKFRLIGSFIMIFGAILIII